MSHISKKCKFSPFANDWQNSYSDKLTCWNQNDRSIALSDTLCNQFSLAVLQWTGLKSTSVVLRIIINFLLTIYIRSGRGGQFHHFVNRMHRQWKSYCWIMFCASWRSTCACETTDGDSCAIKSLSAWTTLVAADSACAFGHRRNRLFSSRKQLTGQPTPWVACGRYTTLGRGHPGHSWRYFST